MDAIEIINFGISNDEVVNDLDVAGASLAHQGFSGAQLTRMKGAGTNFSGTNLGGASSLA